MTTSQVQSGTQDFETQGVQLPNADVVHAAGPATDVDQNRPRHWRPREPRIDHWCENHGPYIKGSRLHVLKTIGSYADLNTGIAVVGIETLAKVCQLHPRQVRRIIKDLAHKRFWFVIVERPRGNNKLGHSNEYHFSGAATQWTPVRQDINAFETKAEGNIRKLTLALELLRSHGVEIPEELQDNSRGDISACPPNDDDEDNTEGTFSYVPSGNAPPAPDLHEHLNGVESSSSLQDKPESPATEEDFADAKEVVDAAWNAIRQKVNRDTGEITQAGWRDKKHAVDRLAWDSEQREEVRDKIPQGRRGYALDPGTAEFQEAKTSARNAARERGDRFDVEAFAREWYAKQRQAEPL